MTLNMRIMSNLDSILMTFWLPSDLVSVAFSKLTSHCHVCLAYIYTYIDACTYMFVVHSKEKKSEQQTEKPESARGRSSTSSDTPSDSSDSDTYYTG